MRITSPAFADKVPIPIQYTSKGANTSPPLEFFDIPDNTRSLALIARDLESADQQVHWIVYALDASVSYFDEGQLPDGAIEGLTSNGKTGYDGPCPEKFRDIHRISFKLYALDTLVQLPQGSNIEAILSAIEGHILESAEVVGIVAGEQAQESV